MDGGTFRLNEMAESFRTSFREGVSVVLAIGVSLSYHVMACDLQPVDRSYRCHSSSCTVQMLYHSWIALAASRNVNIPIIKRSIAV